MAELLSTVEDLKQKREELKNFQKTNKVKSVA
jgi:hypothetical protein